MKFINNFKQSIKLLGLINYCLYGLNRILNKISFNKVRIIKYYFFAQPVNPDPIVKNLKKRNIKVREVYSDESIVNHFPRPESVIKDRFSQNARCFSAIKNDNDFVGYIWLCENEYIEDEVRCKFIPYPKGDAVWDFDVYIKPENRLSLAFPLLWDHVNQYLAEKNYHWSLSRISAFNPVSLSVHKKMGAENVGSTTFICIGQLQVLLSSFKPYVSVSLVSFPQIKVHAPIKD